MKMSIDNYLSYEEELVPNWIMNHEKGDKVDLDEIFTRDRVVFYPGSGIDGEPIKIINKAHYAHTYLYVDYNYKREEIEHELLKEDVIKGYSLVDMIKMPIYVISRMIDDYSYYRATEYSIIFHDDEEPMNPKQSGIFVPYCFICIFERKIGYDESFGAKRFCLVYLCHDLFGAYYRFFIQQKRVPAILVLKNYMAHELIELGSGSNLEILSRNKDALPEYILCERNTPIWREYSIVPRMKKVLLDGAKKEVLSLYAQTEYADMNFIYDFNKQLFRF